MLQDIITYLIIFLSVVFAFFKIKQSFKSKNVSKCGNCDGCECELKNKNVR